MDNPTAAELPPASPLKTKDLFDDGVSPLTRIPIDIAHHRAALFALETPVQFDQKAWDRYWPFIDNVWCLHSKQDAPSNLASGNTEKFWGGCRLQRKWKHGDVNTEGRKRTRREPGQCPAKFRLTVHPNGVRILERSKEAHSHDLDHIDSIKRNSGIRSLVGDPLFASWESGPILAYLKDTSNAPSTNPDLLTEAGGRYLERREIINIFAQHLKKAYPNLDASQLKKQKEKYEGVKTCNFKGCNLSFSDGKALVKHRKEAHEEKKHDHSGRLYMCPCKTCHRRKKSKGFPSSTALHEHQLRMQHYGPGVFQGQDGVQYIEGPTEAEILAFQSRDGARNAADRTSPGAHEDASPPQHSPGFLSATANGDGDVLSAQRPLPTGMPVFPRMPGEDDAMPIDPVMQQVEEANAKDKRDTMLRLQALEAKREMMEQERERVDQEMERLRSALLTE
ncbi:hypothetical protein BLS_000987 [Venturia inaequalis]|uniref:C2H2-type domain-containing protein n=1 Tax=Venturia inaequalis TaxID=5025 RepID=A0A8H3VPD7_VENIN|nr:hypothetical protein BLS_000987 [Venturia inaequalis]KAE9984351.1 hypothetical protein EG328_008836 [Venturia inaequalis]KAE9991378.1 hypothetical protein EG327_011754 [Venturia inaequalis]RDI76899.1 hypothetical protein Vi05172_g13110 [Venturia inaequalis]